MPPKRAPESKDVKECMLRIGKNNNIIAWNLDIRESIGAIYGYSGDFLYSDVRFVRPLPREEDYLVVYPDGEDDLEPLPMSAALLPLFTGRAKLVRKQKIDEEQIWSTMWMRMSTASQSKVKEDDGFLAARDSKDCVAL